MVNTTSYNSIHIDNTLSFILRRVDACWLTLIRHDGKMVKATGCQQRREHDESRLNREEKRRIVM